MFHYVLQIRKDYTTLRATRYLDLYRVYLYLPYIIIKCGSCGKFIHNAFMDSESNL